MIRVSTLADVCRANYSLGLYCMRCERWEEADLERLVEGGHGDRLLCRSRFRCRDCGEPADKQLRPPVPALGGAVAYIEPQQSCRR